MRARAALLLALPIAVAVAGCDRAATGEAAGVWRADCPTSAPPEPLGLEAARDAHRLAARRHELRLREAADPGAFLRAMHDALDEREVVAGSVCLDELAALGRLLFEHEYGVRDGLGGGATASGPTGPFRRVHAGIFGGPETISCPSCHWVGGPNGAGAETDGAFLEGDGVRPASADERNAPALLGLGVVEALAREMTRDLQRQRADLVRAAARDGALRAARLASKGVDFGMLRVGADGTIDASRVRGVDADLVVKPFGWKGTLAHFADFAAEALQVHIGIQTDGLVATGARDLLGGGDPRDPDGDGVAGELEGGPFTALTAHLALLELPVIEPLVQDRALPPAATGLLPPTTTSFAEDFQRGRRQFHELGCAGCHVPMLVLESPILALDGMPPIDLSRAVRGPGLRYDTRLGGWPVWLFSDLKRHDMGPANAARRAQRGVARREYLTPRLWGLADSAPYLHDGRAPTFDYAIAGHEGEGAAARAAFEALPPADRGPLRVYLMSLRRASRVIVP